MERRNRAKDELLFDCKLKAEHDYVTSLYEPSERPYVRLVLRQACEEGKLKYATHMEVYQLVNEKLSQPVPT